MKRRKQLRTDLRLRSERATTSRRKETHKYQPSQSILRVEWNRLRPTICLGNIGSWKGGSFLGTILHSYLTRWDDPSEFLYQLPLGDGGGAYFLVMGMCRWMGWHFHGWIDCNGVAFSLELLEWGRTFSEFGESENPGRDFKMGRFLLR